MKNKYMRLCCCILAFVILCVVLVFVGKKQDDKDTKKPSQMELESEVKDNAASDQPIPDSTSDLTDETIIVESNESDEKSTQETIPKKETNSNQEVNEGVQSGDTNDSEWSKDYYIEY